LGDLGLAESRARIGEKRGKKEDSLKVAREKLL